MVTGARHRPSARVGRNGARAVARWMLVPAVMAAGQSPLERLPPEDRARALWGLLALILLGLLLLIVLWISRRWIHRTIRASRRPYRSGPIGPSDWEPRGTTVPPPIPPGGDHDRHA